MKTFIRPENVSFYRTDPNLQGCELPADIPRAPATLGKQALRRSALEDRDNLSDTHRVKASDDVAHSLMNYLGQCGLSACRQPNKIGIYLPIGSELNLYPFAFLAKGAGYELALPIAGERSSPMNFAMWAPGQPVSKGRFGNPEPSEGAAICIPDVMVVPGIAFDLDGYRLGWGGGFYDATLQRARSDGQRLIAIGAGFQAQVRDSLPRELHDARLDCLITEIGILFPSNGSISAGTR